MLGAIAGDIIGSVYEWNAVKHKQFELFSERAAPTDDSILTLAVADALMGDRDYARSLREYARAYPNAGYGGSFSRWFREDGAGPYDSFGNGSAMRVSPVAWYADTLDEALAEAEASAIVTHNHPEGIRGAQATALCIFLARQGESKAVIRQEVTTRFGYDLARSIDALRPHYRFDVTCQGSVPESIICFLEATDYEDAIRNAISLGGDADTMACIAGSIAEAFFGEVSDTIADFALERLDERCREVYERFAARHMRPHRSGV